MASITYTNITSITINNSIASIMTSTNSTGGGGRHSQKCNVVFKARVY